MEKYIQKKMKLMGKRLTTEEFIERAQKIHGNKYDYSLVKYENNEAIIKIICPKHGIFEQRVNNHLQKSGCPYCAGNIKKDTISFIEQSNKIHGDKYDYSLVNYKISRKKVKIIW